MPNVPQDTGKCGRFALETARASATAHRAPFAVKPNAPVAAMVLSLLVEQALMSFE